MKILLVSGARPNYMKIAPIVWAIRDFNSQHGGAIRFVLVHTGQHYDRNLFEVFFQELNLPAPDFCLDVGSGSRDYQIETVVARLEPILEQVRPDLVLVVGDVNSTLAATQAAVKHGILVAHVEAGLRSFDSTMPEEVNRVMTDSLAEYLFVSEERGETNLFRRQRDDRFPPTFTCILGALRYSGDFRLEGRQLRNCHSPPTVERRRFTKASVVDERVGGRSAAAADHLPRPSTHAQAARVAERLAHGHQLRDGRRSGAGTLLRGAAWLFGFHG